MKKELKDRLREAMEARGLRSVDIVEKTDIPKVTISYYMNGKTEPRADKLGMIAKVLDVSEAWLLGYDVEMQRTQEQKKNDQLAQLIVRLRADADFYDAVVSLDGLSASRYETVKQLLSTLSE